MVERDGDLEVLLPTGEPVCFDATTHEVTGGVLRETGPIDTRKNRHRRRFAAVEYTGGGIWLRANQRGQSPEKARVWGRERRVGIEYDGEVCRVPRRRVWEQETGWFDLRFETDGAFFEFVEER